MTTIVLFTSSLFVASGLVAVKALELKRGNRNFILKLVGKLDAKSMALVSMIKFRLLQFVQSLRYIATVKSKEVAIELFNKMKDVVVSEYRIRQMEIMGRKDIASKGSVSFYLKKITEDKGSGGKGKIEDSF